MRYNSGNKNYAADVLSRISEVYLFQNSDYAGMGLAQSLDGELSASRRGRVGRSETDGSKHFYDTSSGSTLPYFLPIGFEGNFLMRCNTYHILVLKHMTGVKD
ncbi:hypothetical protein NPIL_582471 [Nephila pilipes]|uniref:Uncharacterized protein n=1 Tax=Nephila pilipes TaxID=299642 RepID=A0A8X6PUA0_NEPPI|nr:hypothetical protein NPIL_582471 [Nephila pilipes]